MSSFRVRCRLAFLLLVGSAALGGASARGGVAGFEDLAIGPGGFENGAGLAGGFVSGGLTFNNNYDAEWESWDGWAYSNVTDNTTAGWGNQYSAITGGGQGGTPNYAVAYRGFTVEPTITVPQNTLIQTAYLTNTTYAYLTIRDGDTTFGAKKFGGENGDDPDWFKLTITGRNADDEVLGAIDVYLADFRPAAERFDNPVKENYILDQWTPVDLSGLGSTVRSLSLSFASTDNDEIWGMNTPAYVALDSLATVPASEITGPPDVQNVAALSLAGGLRELGSISGGGALTVQSGTTLVADAIVQDSLVIEAGGAVVIRESGAPAASAVPEPELLAMLLGGAAAAGFARMKRRAAAARR